MSVLFLSGNTLCWVSPLKPSNGGRPNRVLTREDLIGRVWDEHWWGSTKTLDVHVASLRQKVEPNPSHPTFIVTVHRLGYRFDG